MLILMSNLRFSSMYVYYSLDREGFIEQLCENKDKPELNCDGKCMLAKMLQAQTDEDEQPMPMIGWEDVLVFFIDLPSYTMPNSNEENRNSWPVTVSYCSPPCSGMLLKGFHLSICK